MHAINFKAIKPRTPQSTQTKPNQTKLNHKHQKTIYLPSMASIPQYNSDFVFCDFPPPLVPENATAMWAHQAGGFPFFDNGEVLPPENDINMPSFSLMAPVPERFGVSDLAVPDRLLPEFGPGLGGIAGGQGYYQQDVCEFGEDSNGFVPEFPLVYPSSNNNWVINPSRSMAFFSICVGFNLKVSHSST